MIAMLLLRYFKERAKYKWQMSNWVFFLRLTLFVNIQL